ncbi:HAD-IIA family hydrolase [Devosia algicola]|uniref:HAD-IIA family hydrolase n=1 Tax=Devosia algicola TaxID=3026418 RepID=A0ABY7YPK6_9HYPH|nr:HAD-IIA family hydrolase [Devosia algicola]WDR03243.1 HAD-IIA family hydrolase [Devosia algicola]
MISPGIGAHPRQLKDVKAVISDLDGVVYRGREAIAGAVETFAAWHERGIPYCFVTNNSTRTADETADKLCGLGVNITPARIVTSAIGTATVLRSRWPSGGRAFVVGMPSLSAAVEAAGFELCQEQADCVVVGLDSNFNYAKMSQAVRLILDGAAFIGTNPDLLLPSENGFQPGNGAILASLAAACGTEPNIIGKPQPFLIDIAVSILDVPRDQVVMIGDQIATDIAAGQRAGVFSILVQTGVPEDGSSTIVPDMIVGNLSDLTL